MEGSSPSNPSPSNLRPATADDLDRLVEIEKAVHVSPWNREHFEAEIQKPYSHVLLLTDDETDTQILGYIVFWLMFDECQILNVAVDLPHRGMGYAKGMVRQAVAAALRKDFRRVLLDVRKSNAPAIQLYQGLKFVITHVRKSFYSNGEDAYEMALFLAGGEPGENPADF